MATPKFEVIRDDDGIVQAYKLGNWYLCKIYGWADIVNWYIFDHLVIHLYEFEKNNYGSALKSEDGQGWVHNCKQGKQILIDRYLADQNPGEVKASTRKFTKYPKNYVKADSGEGRNSRRVLFEVCHTQPDGKRVTGQLYTAGTVSNRLLDILQWGGTDITVTEYKE